MLKGCRALDLTDEKGFFCGKMLGDLGVDVIKVERPGGDASRNVGPFWGDIPDPEKSLYWFAYNSNKRGITLNIETADGREIFKDLVRTCDFVIESFRPGYLKGLGLNYDKLAEVRSDLIVTSVTPFGQTGPYANYEASDLVVMGMSGLLYLTGDTDRPPVTISVPQTFLHAGCDAAAASMLAYYHRQMTGEGQHVDISMQQSTGWFLGNTMAFYEMKDLVLQRAGAYRTGVFNNDLAQRQVWQCKDGYIFFFILGGVSGAKTNRPLTEWMASEGMADEYLLNMDWENLDMGPITQDEIDRMSNPIAAFFLTKTKKEILDGALKRTLSICPLSSMKDLVDDPHLEFRNFWTELKQPGVEGTFVYPGHFVTSSEVDIETRFRAPLIGEHNREVYGEMGLSNKDLVALKEAGVI